MKTDEESAPRTSNGAGSAPKKKKRRQHIHIGPNVRAFRRGVAFCPMCDAERMGRLTEAEREVVREAKLKKA